MTQEVDWLNCLGLSESQVTDKDLEQFCLVTEALNEIFDASNFDDQNEIQVDSVLMDKLSKILLQIDLVRQRLAHTVSELLKAAKKSTGGA